MSVTQQQVLDGLAKVRSPRGVALTNANVLSAITVNDGKVFFSINVDAAEARAWESVRAQAEAAVRAIPGVTVAMIALTAERKPGPAAPPAPHRHAHGVPPVSSHRAAAKSGVADVEAVGNSRHCRRHRGGLRQGRRRKIDHRAQSGAGPARSRFARRPARRRHLRAVGAEADRHSREAAAQRRQEDDSDQRFGLAIMSIGFLVEEDTAMIWRGPMVMSAITQMLRDVAWGTLDILVVDMPPGTGDAQLTLAQNVPLKGAIIISTPQDLSLIDARRGLAMFKKVNVPVLGIVENMSYFQCPHCGTRSDIFGHGGARHEAERLGVPFLGEIPLHMSIRATSDSGTPVVESEPDGPHAAIYRAIGSQGPRSAPGRYRCGLSRPACAYATFV